MWPDPSASAKHAIEDFQKTIMEIDRKNSVIQKCVVALTIVSIICSCIQTWIALRAL